ncbi:MAG: zinc-ribbon domain containing protein [Chloroflexi bacterium]|nr:zinc-ribbon domain containing protein [Chloroflexota bacterium]
MYSDKVLNCVDCGNEFAFSSSEQEFYADRQFSEPRRCTSCRASRKAARGDSGGGGGSSYGGGSSFGNSGGYGGGGGGGFRDRGPREMFEATCSSCGNTASVPFRPTSGKPVYCNDCFAKRRA